MTTRNGHHPSPGVCDDEKIKFAVTIAAKAPVYCTIEVEAATLQEANEIAARIVSQPWKAPELHITDFVPEWDAVDSFEVFTVEEAT